ncbi:MAG: methyltransferase domain-containing protein [Cyanosarcina radialis HA8281-LM2]|jgi:trans-aconitate methyltransferase|nr:methyltransferase domain-containing protein [Cyanosarcina radialis HA8281-LM2]
MYEWQAKDYHKNSAGQHKFAKDLIAKLEFKGNERVLDIGCGDGKITAEIATYVTYGEVLGIDRSPNMIHFARSNFTTDKFPNLAFECQDARNLDFDDRFDLITSFSCLHWIIDHMPVLTGMQKSLKSGGKVALQFGGKGNAQKIKEAADEVIDREKWRQYFQDFDFPYAFYGVDEYRTWLNDAGLKATRLELVPKEMIHPDKAALEAWLRTTWMPFTSRVSQDLQSEFIADTIEMYIRHNPPDDEGKIYVNMVRLEVEATK